jgi:hypothetical protein
VSPERYPVIVVMLRKGQARLAEALLRCWQRIADASKEVAASDDVCGHLRRSLNAEQREGIQRQLHLVPEWMRSILRSIVSSLTSMSSDVFAAMEIADRLPSGGMLSR